jgi:hypothetical protein
VVVELEVMEEHYQARNIGGCWMISLIFILFFHITLKYNNDQ